MLPHHNHMGMIPTMSLNIAGMQYCTYYRATPPSVHTMPTAFFGKSQKFTGVSLATIIYCLAMS